MGELDHPMVIVTCLMLEPFIAEHGGAGSWLTLLDVIDLEAGHPADERQGP